MDFDVTSLHHRRATRRWERMSVGDLIERVTWSRPDKPAIVGRPGAYADERLAALTYRQADLPETVGGKVLKYRLRAEHSGHYRNVTELF